MKKLLLQCLLCIYFINPIFAQESTSEEPERGINLSGSIDLYYKYDFSGHPNIGTSFASDHNSFSIGMFNIMAEKSVGKASFVADIAMGPRNAASAGPSLDELQPGIQNLYVSYALTDKLQLTAGYMGTYVGYEVISPTGNFNYSTSYLFTNGPFQNAGVKLQYQISEKIAIMAGIFNDWNVYQQAEGENVSSFGGQLSIAPNEDFSIFLNVIEGKNNGGELDLTTGYQVTEKLYFGLNAAYWSYDIPATTDVAKFSGIALYSNYGISETVSIGLRAESFSTENTAYIGLDLNSAIEAKKVNAFTLSANIGAGALKFIPEIRADIASEEVFLDASSNPSAIAFQALGALVFSF